MKVNKKYSEEQYNWLRTHYLNYTSYVKLTEDFNLYFEEDRSVCSLRQILTKKLKLYVATEKTAEHFTKEQENWLIDNYKKFDIYSDLTREFNRIFSRTKTVESISEKCTKRLGLSGMPNITKYRKGHIKDQCQIGTIRTSTNGYRYIKVKNGTGSYINGYQEPYWLPIQKKIWQDHYGEVPEGKFVIFLDGDRENLDINNLYCIDRQISAIMAANKWFTNSRVHTLTAIKWCELYYEMYKKRV